MIATAAVKIDASHNNDKAGSSLLAQTISHTMFAKHATTTILVLGAVRKPSTLTDML